MDLLRFGDNRKTLFLHQEVDDVVLASRKKRPTLGDIASALGVSRATVSNAFNKPDIVAPVLLEKILTHSKSIGYAGPDPMARAMRRRQVHEVAVVFHHDLSYALSDDQSVQFLQGVAQELDRRHLSLQMIPKMGRRFDLSMAFQTTADALIIHDQVTQELLPQLSMVHKPFVLVDTLVDGAPSVRIDDLQGARLAMAHVLRSRPEQVIVWRFPIEEPERIDIENDPFALQSHSLGGARIAGYLQAIAQAAYPLERVRWIEVDDAAPEESVRLHLPWLMQVLQQARVGVACMSDRIALALMDALGSEAGKLLSIVGFDDVPRAAALGLSTIRQDSRLKGVSCVKTLFDGTGSVVLPCEFVTRKT